MPTGQINGTRPQDGCGPEVRSGGIPPNFFMFIVFFLFPVTWQLATLIASQAPPRRRWHLFPQAALHLSRVQPFRTIGKRLMGGKTYRAILGVEN